MSESMSLIPESNSGMSLRKVMSVAFGVVALTCFAAAGALMVSDNSTVSFYAITSAPVRAVTGTGARQTQRASGVQYVRPVAGHGVAPEAAAPVRGNVRTAAGSVDSMQVETEAAYETEEPVFTQRTTKTGSVFALLGGALMASAAALALTIKSKAATVAQQIATVTECEWNPSSVDGTNRVWGMLATGAAPVETDVKTAISGFGRIGRNVLRCWAGRDKKPFDIVAINAGSMTPEQAAHLLKYDSVLGTFDAEVEAGEDSITVNGKKITLVATRDPSKAPWKELGVELVIEGTGAFNSKDGSAKHLEAGAKKVVITAPGKECPTYVMAVNADQYDPANDHVISNASCTTNGMAPVCKVLEDEFGIKYGTMTTTHSYTGDQMILDGRHSDLRRARAGALNIVPTSTGAAKAVALVLPSLKGKLNGIALRVPTPNVSVVDLVVEVDKPTTKEEVNAAIAKAAEGPMKGVLGYTDLPLVSSDFKGTNVSSTVDGQLSMVMGDTMVKVVCWYDNEWGYSQRVVDLASVVADKM